MTISLGIRCADGVVLATDSMVVAFGPGRRFLGGQVVTSPAKISHPGPHAWAVRSNGPSGDHRIVAERGHGAVQLHQGDGEPVPVGSVLVIGAAASTGWWPRRELQDVPGTIEGSVQLAERIAGAFIAACARQTPPGGTPVVSWPLHVLTLEGKGLPGYRQIHGPGARVADIVALLGTSATARYLGEARA